MDADNIGIILTEGDSIAARFALERIGDGITRVLYERPDDVSHVGVAAALLIAFTHIVGYKSEAIPDGAETIADLCKELMDPTKEDFPF